MERIFEILETAGVTDFIIKESFWFSLSAIFVFISVLIDLWTGIDKAKVLNEKIYSGGFRRSIIKLKEYIFLMYFGTVADVALFVVYKQVPAGVLLACVACCLIELISVIENLKAKKSEAGKMPEILEQIVQCDSKQKSIRFN